MPEDLRARTVALFRERYADFRSEAPACSLLVYVDDATGRAMELRFVQFESAFDYFAATASYLRRPGKPVAFYSDKHSIFRVYRSMLRTATRSHAARASPVESAAALNAPPPPRERHRSPSAPA